MGQDPSRWWYALVPFPVLGGFQSVLVWLTTGLLPTAGPSRSEAMPILFLGLGSSLVGALVVAAAPLFVVGVVLDIRALRNRSSWTPHWGYGALGLFPVLGIFSKWVGILAIPTTIGYLGLRRRRVGYPLGRPQEVQRETPIDADQSSIQPPASPWWYGVVIPPVLELTGAFVFWTVRRTGVLRQGSDPLTLLIPVALALVAFGLVLLFAVSLYADAKTVEDASGETVLDPRAWGVLGLGSIVGLVLVRTTFMPIVALAYVLSRRLATGPEQVL